jgi:hypothetical protein
MTVEDIETRGRQFRSSDESTWFGSGRFSCVLRCPRCGEICAAAGNIWIDYIGVDESNYDLTPTCHPQIVTPSPQIIPIPKKCPSPVKSEVQAAFLLYWADHAASLNRIRNALELVLTELKVPRTTVNRSGRRQSIKLHDRIVALETRKPALQPLCGRMMAVKHLGNAGSHAGEKVEKNDLFDAFDILERMLGEMYGTTDGDLARIVREINKRKGPRKKKA